MTNAIYLLYDYLLVSIFCVCYVIILIFLCSCLFTDLFSCIVSSFILLIFLAPPAPTLCGFSTYSNGPWSPQPTLSSCPSCEAGCTATSSCNYYQFLPTVSSLSYDVLCPGAPPGAHLLKLLHFLRFYYLSIFLFFYFQFIFFYIFFLSSCHLVMILW